MLENLGMGADCTNGVANGDLRSGWYTFRVGGRGNIMVLPTNKEIRGRQMRRISVMHENVLAGGRPVQLAGSGSREATDGVSEGVSLTSEDATSASDE